MGTSPVLARQFIGALLKNPERLGEFPDALEVLDGEKMAVSAYGAVVKLQKNGITPSLPNVANAMSQNGWKEATAAQLKSDCVDLATLYGDTDPSEPYKMMKFLKDQNQASKKLNVIARDLEYGKISPREAIDMAGSIPISDISERAVISTDDFAVKVPAMFQKRRQLLESKNLLTIPTSFPGLRKEIKMLEFGTIISIVAKSGVGKSMTAMDWGEHWARNNGRSVLYVSTELPLFVLVSRYINKLTGIPVSKLLEGYFDDRCAAAMSTYTSGGRIHFMEGAGMSPAAIFAEARKRKADVILDYFDMTDISDSKFNGGYNANKTDMIGHALTEAKEYAQPNDRVVMILWQVSMGKEDVDEVRLSDTMDSIRPKQRSNYGFALNFPRVQTRKGWTIPPYPGEGDLDLGVLWDEEQEFSCVGSIRVEKDSFTGKSGTKVPIFRDGTRSRIYECKINAQKIIQPFK